MELEPLEREMLTRCLMLGIVATKGDAGVVATIKRLIEKLGLAGEFCAASQDSLDRLTEKW